MQFTSPAGLKNYTVASVSRLHRRCELDTADVEATVLSGLTSRCELGIILPGVAEKTIKLNCDRQNIHIYGNMSALTLAQNFQIAKLY